MAAMKILVVSASFPRPDQASGDLRFFSILRLLAHKHQVCFCALDDHGNILPADSYGRQLEEIGVCLGIGKLPDALKSHMPDVVWFEFFHQARADYVALVRRLCPLARVMIDSVDVHFNRLASQARLSGRPEDHEAAERMKQRELSAYALGDLVVAVSDEDGRLLREFLRTTAVGVIPNVHEVPTYPDPAARRFGELVFVGGFKHAPNVDAMLYFCREILPLITSPHPTVQLTIIGSNPPDEIKALADRHVDVVGFVPETEPYLRRAYISVAPLRFGGGMKGKVGEAMSFGLPVVTTSFGVEGFGLETGKDVLVGDTPAEFAAQVISLLEHPDLHARGRIAATTSSSATTVSLPWKQNSMTAWNNCSACLPGAHHGHGVSPKQREAYTIDTSPGDLAGPDPSKFVYPDPI